MASHAHRFATLDLPRPGRSGLPFIGLALLALVLAADPSLRLVGVGAAVCFALAAALRVARTRRELAVVRRATDRLILADPHAEEVSELVQWRARELVASTEREALRHEVERLLRQLDAGHLPSASPLRRVPLRRHEDLMRAIARRVDDGRPVSARGILLVRRLLREPSSPLYNDVPERELARALSRVLGALE